MPPTPHSPTSDRRNPRGHRNQLSVFMVAAFTWLALYLPASAQTPTAPSTSAVGVLKCDISGGLSFVIGSTRRLDCIFTPDDGPAEFYAGTISRFGVDIGFLQSGVMLWQVISPAVPVGPGGLAGTFVGISSDVAAGVGVGANALVGTSKLMLNPISIEGIQGLNLALGVAEMTLELSGEPLPLDPNRQ